MGAPGEREMAQEPLVLAVDPTSKQDELVALVICVVYRQRAIPAAWHIVGAQAKGSWIEYFCRLRCRYMCSVTRAGQSRPVGADCGFRLACLPALPAPRRLSARGPDPTRAGALADHGTGRPVGRHGSPAHAGIVS